MITPGPWHLIAVDGGDFTAISTLPTIPDDEFGPRNMDLDHEVLGSSEWLRVTPCDLQLMASAPELLSLLNEILEGYEFACSEERQIEIELKISKAIMKAEGTVM